MELSEAEVDYLRQVVEADIESLAADDGDVPLARSVLAKLRGKNRKPRQVKVQERVLCLKPKI